MATLRTYSATTDELGALSQWRLNEQSGTIAGDSADGLDGSYQGGTTLGEAGIIGDGGVRFDGANGLVFVETLSGSIRVSAYGDSLIAGFGIPNPDDRFADDLQEALAARGLNATVIDRGVSGETAAQGLTRVQTVVNDDADVVIVEFGTNDANQQIPAATVEDNIRDMIEALQAGDSEVLLAGAFGYHPEKDGGAGYPTEALRDQFEQIFPDLAAELNATLLRDSEGSDKFLGGSREGTTITGGVLDDPALNIGDGLHPNAAGVDQIVGRVTPQTIALGAAAGVVDDALLLANGTFEMWFIADDVSGDHALFSKSAIGFGTGGHLLGLVDDGAAAVTLASASQTFEVRGGTVQAGTAAHVVFTFGAGGMQLYVDGSLVDSDGYTGGLDLGGGGFGNFEALVIGADTSASTSGTTDAAVNFFDGVFDEFAVYDRALSGGQITDLYQAGLAGPELVGTAAADTLIGGADDETLKGGAGNDLVLGDGGADELRGGAGDDEVRGGEGQDDIFGGDGADLLFGGVGADIVRGSTGIDVVRGEDGNDELRGGAGGDELRGGKGIDELLGGDGADQLFGGSGADLVQGSTGDDTLYGGDGGDELRGGAGNDSVFGEAGDEAIFGGDGDDRLHGDDGNDQIEGGAGSDELLGSTGTDVLTGNEGADTLRGGGGADQMNGSKGNDVLIGGAGQDTLTGGAGADTFRVDDLGHGIDDILDFEAGSGGDILASLATTFANGDDPDDFVQLNEVGGNTEVALNADGVGGDFVTVFNLIGVTGLSVDQLASDGNLSLG